MQRPRGRNRELGGKCSKMMLERQMVLTRLGLSGHVKSLTFISRKGNLWKISKKGDDVWL